MLFELLIKKWMNIVPSFDGRSDTFYKISVFQLSATRFTLSPDSDPDTLATNSKTATAKSDLYKM